MIIPIDGVRKRFLKFRDQCIWFRACYNTYAALFEGGPEVDALLNLAPTYFTDLNNIMIEYCWLQVCRLTDPAVMAGRTNLTVARMNELLTQHSLMNAEVAERAAGLQAYRKLVEGGRNRVISHADEEALMVGDSVGEHDAGSVTTFLDNLQAYADAVGTALGVGPSDFRTLACKGDVIDFLSVMQRRRE